MSAQATAKAYRQITTLKDDKFNVDDIHGYTLSLSIGIRDFQACVTDKDNRVLFVEDVKLENVKTINTRVQVLKEVFDDHHFLKAGFWQDVKVGIKSHKFTLVPQSHFMAETQADYLSLNCEIKPKIEGIHNYYHNVSDAVNIFAIDKKLLNWINSVYPKKDIKVIHQGSAFISGILSQEPSSPNKCVYCLVDRGILHLVIGEGKKLIYYNQFAARKSEDFLKYTMLVFKELGLSQKTTPMTVWGLIKENSPHLELLRKYIKHIEMGSRPTDLTFGVQLNGLVKHRYFDLFSIHLC